MSSEVAFFTTLIVAIMVVVANSLLAFIVYKNNTKSATSRVFAVLSVLTSLWLIVIHLSTLPQLHAVSLWLIRINLFLAVPQVLAFFLLAHTVPHTKIRLKKSKLIALLVASVSVMAITVSPYTFTAVTHSKGAPSPEVGWGIGFFMLYAVGLSIVTMATLVRRERKARGVEKQQLFFVSSGVAIMLGLIIVTILIPAVAFQNTMFVNAAPVYVLLFLMITSYAIVKHQLFDIRLLVARAVAYALLVTTLFSFYTVAVFGVSSVLHQGEIESNQVIIYAILAIFVGATFQPLKRYFDRVTEKIFYKSRYSTSELISQITSIMAETLILEDLTTLSLQQVMSTLQISHGSFWVATKDGLVCMADINHNLECSPAIKGLLEGMSQSNHIMVAEEDVEDGHGKMLRRINSTIAAPLASGDELQGILLLGPKKSGEIYTDKDISTLRILAPGLAIAVENARSYRQISEFNVTLEQEITRATKDLQSANEKLSRNNEKLRQLDRLKDEFISVTSHELRTPLTAIRGYIWMAMHGKNKDKSFDDYMKRAYLSTERLITMVNDTLDVSRIESGRMKFANDPTDLNKLAQEVIDNLSAKARQQSQELVLKKTRALPLVGCDSDKIYQVLTNLVGNAIKFTPNGGKITVDFKQRGNEVITRVKDDGPGISAEDQDKLFQKFSRLESATSIPGTGLGLYLCQRIIKLSGGKIWIESNVGQGAAFLFTLKVSKSQIPVPPKSPQQFRNISAA